MKQRIAAAVIIVAAAMGAWYLWRGFQRAAPPTSDPEQPVESVTSLEHPADPAEGGETISLAAEAENEKAKPVPQAGEEEALRDYRSGVELMRADKLVEARQVLSKALNYGKLDEPACEAARKALSECADKTIFSAVVHKDDPSAFHYILEPGDILERLERKLQLRVPCELILKINGIQDASKLRAGQTIKMIRGPFHAVIHKSRFAMDVYLGDTFVRRFKVCVGTPQTPTPEGFFQVRLGGKLRSAPYTPPPSSGQPQRAILPGEAGYPLDRQGLWISLTGIAEKGTNYTEKDGYGIHGTNDPESIGTAASHGCIRLADADIDLVFALLYEKWSTVTILP